MTSAADPASGAMAVTRGAIWFVEDDADDIALLGHACPRAGITDWRTFEHGPALQKHLEETPDTAIPALMVLDINLPMMDGFELLRWLRERHDADALPIAMLSTSRDERDMTKARQLGATAYFIKPNEFGALVSLLCQIASLRRAGLV